MKDNNDYQIEDLFKMLVEDESWESDLSKRKSVAINMYQRFVGGSKFNVD